jgi:hypothetical protein
MDRASQPCWNPSVTRMGEASQARPRIGLAHQRSQSKEAQRQKLFSGGHHSPRPAVCWSRSFRSVERRHGQLAAPPHRPCCAIIWVMIRRLEKRQTIISGGELRKRQALPRYVQSSPSCSARRPVLAGPLALGASGVVLAGGPYTVQACQIPRNALVKPGPVERRGGFGLPLGYALAYTWSMHRRSGCPFSETHCEIGGLQPYAASK